MPAVAPNFICSVSIIRSGAGMFWIDARTARSYVCSSPPSAFRGSAGAVANDSALVPISAQPFFCCAYSVPPGMPGILDSILNRSLAVSSAWPTTFSRASNSSPRSSTGKKPTMVNAWPSVWTTAPQGFDLSSPTSPLPPVIIVTIMSSGLAELGGAPPSLPRKA